MASRWPPIYLEHVNWGDLYLTTYLTGSCRVPPPVRAQPARQPPVPEGRQCITVKLAQKPCYDAEYDSDSEDDCDRQRRKRLPRDKLLVSNGTWKITSKTKKTDYERMVKAEHAECTEIIELKKEYQVVERK